MMRPVRLPVLLLTLLALAPAGATAQFSPLPPAQTTPTVVVAPPDPDDGGLQGWQQTLVFLAGGLLLAGIGWAIVRDARHRAPVKPGEEAHPGAGAPKANRSAKQRQRARAKARQARRQRRRNR